MTTNKILEIELELKKNGLTNLGIAVFKKKFLQKYEVALLIGPNEPFFWDNFKKSKEFNSSRKNPLNNWSKRIIDEISKKFSGIFPLIIGTILFLSPKILKKMFLFLV